MLSSVPRNPETFARELQSESALSSKRPLSSSKAPERTEPNRWGASPLLTRTLESTSPVAGTEPGPESCPDPKDGRDDHDRARIQRTAVMIMIRTAGPDCAPGRTGGESRPVRVRGSGPGVSSGSESRAAAIPSRRRLLTRGPSRAPVIRCIRVHVP